MKEREPKPSFLTWEAAAIVLASVGFGAILSSEKVRSRIGKELWLYYRGFRNIARRRQEARQSKEERSKFQELLERAFPRGLGAEK